MRIHVKDSDGRVIATFVSFSGDHSRLEIRTGSFADTVLIYLGNTCLYFPSQVRFDVTTFTR